MNTDLIDRMVTITEDITRLFAPQRINNLKQRIAGILLTDVNVIKDEYTREDYTSNVISVEQAGEFFAVKRVLYLMNTDRTISEPLRDGLSTVLAKLAIIKKYNPSRFDYYIKRGDLDSYNELYNINEDIARLTVLATKNDYMNEKTANEVINGKMCLDTNFAYSIYSGYSLAITSYIENDDRLATACNYAMYQGFFSELNSDMIRLEKYTQNPKLWYAETDDEEKHSTIALDIFESLKDLQKNMFKYGGMITGVDNSVCEKEYNRFDTSVGYTKRKAGLFFQTRKD